MKTRLRAAARGITALGGVALLAGGTVLHAGVRAGGASLVSEAEAVASAKAFAEHPEGPEVANGKHLYMSANPDAPELDVLMPKVGLPARPPFDVRVAVRPRDGLAVDRSSIRIRYGFFRIDITKRMLALGRWEGNEFIVRQAKAPAGIHWFYVTVADTAHHAASVSLQVVVQ